MTRINVVDPVELSGKHLVAEYRELPRIFGYASRAHGRGEHPDSYPDTYRLGEGHMKFFYPRLLYLQDRFESLVREMHMRGYKTTYEATPEVWLPLAWWQHYVPTAEALAINRQRLFERTKPK